MSMYRIVKQRPNRTAAVIIALVELSEDDVIVIQKREPEIIFREVSCYRSD